MEGFGEILKERWEAGCHNARLLSKELKDRGFLGSYITVSRFVAPWREGESSAGTAASEGGGLPIRALAKGLLSPETDLKEETRRLIEGLSDTTSDRRSL